MANRGRPRLPVENRLSENVRIMLTQEQFAGFERVAELEGRSMSSIAREVIANYLEEKNAQV